MHRVHRVGLHLHPTSASSKTEDEVLYRVEDGVAILTFNRPTRGNAYTNVMIKQLFDQFDRAEADPEVCAIVLTGAGSVFCVGFDKNMNATEQVTVRDTRQTQLLRGKKPFIAAINGPVAGLGLVSACMADVRFATKGVKLTTAFAKRGLIAEHGLGYVLPKMIGVSRAMDLLMSSRVVLAEEALTLGLVNFLADSPQACLRDAVQYARDCGRLCSPAAIAEIKEQLYVPLESPEADSERAGVLMHKSFSHPDFIEGFASLNEKRPAKFEGLKAGRIRDL